MNRGSFAEALPVLKDYLSQSRCWSGPRTYHGHAYLALCMHSLGLYNQALPWAKDAVSIAPHDPLAHRCARPSSSGWSHVFIGKARG
jgi:hypothetical protein